MSSFTKVLIFTLIVLAVIVVIAIISSKKKESQFVMANVRAVRGKGGQFKSGFIIFVIIVVIAFLSIAIVSQSMSSQRLDSYSSSMLKSHQ